MCPDHLILLDLITNLDFQSEGLKTHALRPLFDHLVTIHFFLYFPCPSTSKKCPSMSVCHIYSNSDPGVPLFEPSYTTMESKGFPLLCNTLHISAEITKDIMMTWNNISAIMALDVATASYHINVTTAYMICCEKYLWNL